MLIFSERILYKARKDVPIVYMVELLKLWQELLDKSEEQVKNKKKELYEAIEFLKQNGKSYKVVAVEELTIPLAKIVGSMLADGSVIKNSNSISILDEEKLNIDEFVKRNEYY